MNLVAMLVLNLKFLDMELTNQMMVCRSGINFESSMSRTPHSLCSDRLSVSKVCELSLFIGPTGKLVMLLSLSCQCYGVT